MYVVVLSWLYLGSCIIFIYTQDIFVLLGVDNKTEYEIAHSEKRCSSLVTNRVERNYGAPI